MESNISMERAGTLVKNLSGELAYFSFKPRPLPLEPPIQNDAKMLALLIEANRKVAYLDAIAEKIPNQNLFLSMYIRKEALDSLEKYINSDDSLDPLIQAALIHYQFGNFAQQKPVLA